MAVADEPAQTSSSPVVNNLDDSDDSACEISTIGNGCTLREAIDFADNGATIDFADGLSGTITLAGTQLTIDKDLTITGPGASNLSVSGNSSSRVFYVAPEVTVSISGLTISGGIAGSYLNGGDYDGGAGILNDGSLTLTQCVVTKNSATDNYLGGGIQNTGGNLTISGCEISENVASGDGGGISTWTYSSTKVTITSSTISGNSAGRWGGGISNDPDSYLELTGSIVSGNSAQVGGGISNADGFVTVTETAITGNQAGDSGGGIFQSTGAANRGTIEVVNSTISGNTASDGGGIGAYISSSIAELVQHTVVRNSTISGNTATNRGGGFFNQDGKATIVLTTITGNQADVAGGGLYSRGGTWDGPVLTEVKGSLVWGNTSATSTPNDLDAESTSGVFNSLGHNLIGAAGASVGLAGTFNATGDQIGITSAGLGALADNGGATKTHALLSGSPAIDAGTCYDAASNLVGTDQRGEARPQGGGCDVGAYESAEASGLSDPGFSFLLPTLSKTYGDPSFPVSGYASSSSGSSGTVYFGTAPGSVGCSVTSDGTVTLTGAATGGDLCKLTAYIASDGTYSSAGPIEQSFAIGQAALTVTADDETITYGGTPTFGVSYSGFIGSDDESSLGGTPAYEFAGITPTSYGPSTTTPANAGTYTITPSGLTAYDYAIGYGPAGTLTINKATATVSIDNLPAEPRGGEFFTPTYATNSDGTPSVASNTTDVCTVDAGVVTFLPDGGTCTLVASVAEGTNHLEATGDAQTFEVAPDILSPDEAIPELITMSEEVGLSRGTVNKLYDALKHWEAGRTTAAVSTLEAFINDVESHTGKKVSEEDAVDLIAAAREIIETILAAAGT